jgi:uncharacterized protein involved in cysteine biosynthesis
MLKSQENALSDALIFENVKYFIISLIISLLVLALIYSGLLTATNGALFEYEIEQEWLRSLANIFAQGVALTIFYFLMVPAMFVILALFTPMISDNIHRRHYPKLDESNSVGVFEGLFHALWLTLIYTLLFILVSPSIFFLGLGYVAFAVLGFFLFRSLLLLDALGSHLSLAQIKQRTRLSGDAAHLPSTLVLFLLSLLPGINLFVPYLAVCVLVHESMSREYERLGISQG